MVILYEILYSEPIGIRSFFTLLLYNENESMRYNMRRYYDVLNVRACSESSITVRLSNSVSLLIRNITPLLQFRPLCRRQS